ncbi:hypothetical protein ACFV07_10820 [Streptomyces anulatus]|uniref:hypothetical protein n=1 Tax=Streptomyces anulatus TaxID=1892 RepID=UPI003690C876
MQAHLEHPVLRAGPDQRVGGGEYVREIRGGLGVMMSIAIFAVMLVWLLILASYVAFRRHRTAHPEEFTGFSVRGGDKLAVVEGLGVLAVAATAVKVPDMRQAAVIGIAFTLALLACYALTARRRRPS